MDEDLKTIPVVEEHLTTERKPVQTGSVRVQKHVETRIEQIEEELLREAVDVRRVEINRPVENVPKIRREGDVIIVPVLEEEITITKRLILKEELHILRRRTKERVVKEVPISRESAVVERLDEHGRVIDSTQVVPAARKAQSPIPKKRRSLLD